MARFNFNDPDLYKAGGSVTPEVYSQCEKVYAEVEKLYNLIGLDYNFDEDEFTCTNTNNVDPEWCDDDLLRSIDHLYEDMGFFLGKRFG